MSRLRARLALTAVAVTAAGCVDWDYYALLNSIPTDAETPKEIHVLLGIDSLSDGVVREAMARGAFSEGDWHLSRVATPFPGTSDAAWTRIMHTERLDGYEYQYYDPTTDELVRSGYWGLFMHAVPWLEKPCYQAFDFSGNGLSGLYYMYRAPWYSLANSLDNTFILLDGRIQSGADPVFMSYMNEIDAMGHMLPREESVAALVEIAQRISDFRGAHPELKLTFTLLSDHGQNFVPCRDEACLVRFQQVMPDLGIKVVTSLGDTSDNEVAAIPIIHTRVNYLSLHVREAQVAEVARRASRASSVDMAVSRVAPPPSVSDAQPPDPAASMPWYGIWRGGVLTLRFGHDEISDTYIIDQTSDFAALDIPWTGGREGIALATDDELFALTATRTYPDLFYRTRTGLAPVGVRYPAQVLISFAHPNASIGFEIPGGANEIAAESFHGAMHRLDTFGVVFTEEGELPPVVRADNVLELLPFVKDRLERDGAYVGHNDINEGLTYLGP